jgi:hypothetical protein
MTMNAKTCMVPNNGSTELKSASGAEALDEPLTNRALFLAVSYLAGVIETESAIARGEPPPREAHARMVETFGWLCASYLATREPTQSLVESVRRQRERARIIEKFNENFMP